MEICFHGAAVAVVVVVVVVVAAIDNDVVLVAVVAAALAGTVLFVNRQGLEVLLTQIHVQKSTVSQYVSDERSIEFNVSLCQSQC